MNMSNTDFNELQTDYSKAVQYMKQQLGVLPQHALMQQWQLLKSKQDKLDLTRLNTSRLQNARKEANLMYIQKVKWLAWIPELSTKGLPIRNLDQSLKGQYVCWWKNDDDEVEDCIVQPWWAEENFGIVALAYAQQKAYEHATLEEIKDADGKVTSLLSGFVDVEGKGVGIEMENFQIHKLQYVPGSQHCTGDMFEKDRNGNI